MTTPKQATTRYFITASDPAEDTMGLVSLFLNGCPWMDDLPPDLGNLIAAAPEMLEALQAALDCLRNPTDETDLLELQIERAIAKTKLGTA
jgi:hypothetical protein